MNGATDAGAMPANLLVTMQTMITAGFANDVELVNQ